MTYPRGTTFTPFVSASTATAKTSTPMDIRTYRALRSYVRWEGQVSGTFIKEATVRIPTDREGGPNSLVSVGRFPASDWTTVETRVLSGSNSQSLFTNSTNELWSYTRHRWVPAAAGNTGSLYSFTSAKP